MPLSDLLLARASKASQGGYGQTDEYTDSPCVLQDFVPFGAAAQKATVRLKAAPKRPEASSERSWPAFKRPGPAFQRPWPA